MTEPSKIETTVEEVVSVLFAAGIRSWTQDQFEDVDKAIGKLIADRASKSKQSAVKNTDQSSDNALFARVEKYEKEARDSVENCEAVEKQGEAAEKAMLDFVESKDDHIRKLEKIVEAARELSNILHTAPASQPLALEYRRTKALAALDDLLVGVDSPESTAKTHGRDAKLMGELIERRRKSGWERP